MPVMVRFWSLLLFTLASTQLLAQQFSMSVGLNTGIMASRTMDTGIDRDTRYRQYYNLKYAPIGLSLGLNYEYIGLMLTPTIINVGQNAYATNINHGQLGVRSINERYLNVPLGLKVHFVNLVFLKISGVTSISAAYLLDGHETISHTDGRMDFPRSTYAVLPAGYSVEYDGVQVPVVEKYAIAEKKDFRTLQVFAGAGLHADWDVSNSWRVMFDLQVNYGLMDPRKESYNQRVESNQTIYDMPGKRRDMFAQLSFGIARYIELDRSDVDRKKKLKGSKKGYRAVPATKLRSTRPRN